MRLDEDFAPYEVLGFTVGSRYSRSEIMEAESRLLATGWYKSVTMRWVAGSEDAIQLVVVTEDAVYSKVSSFNVGSPSMHPPCLLPRSIQTDVTTMLLAKENPSKQTLSDVQEKVERWYHDQGYVCAKVKGFQVSEAGALECHVDEGIVTSISVSCEDEAGQPTGCYTKKEIVLEALPKAVSPLHLFD
jgi:outer membrane protein assembly factor BamA